MKKIVVIFVLITNVYSWEINTHRAIDQMAIGYAKNLTSFLSASGLKNYVFQKNVIGFDGYGMTYTKYITKGELNGMSLWKQSFNENTATYKELIEAGSILEDAQWPHTLNGGSYNFFDMGDGRFVNHFYDAQSFKHNLHGLYMYGIQFEPTNLWGLGRTDFRKRLNAYSYVKALDYFKEGFTNPNPTVRRKNQAKMLVSVGQLMHLMNDMSSTAHTRDDPHKEGDIMEVWGSSNRGFRVEGNTVKSYSGVSKNPDNSVPKYSRFEYFITGEARWTSTHFFSKDTIFTKPLPKKSDTYKELVSSSGDIYKYYIKRNSGKNTKLAIHVRSYILDTLREKYYADDKVWMGFDKTTSFKGDYTVIEENAKILIPRAIANARNFVNYFFRGQISAAVTDHKIVVRNRSNASLLAYKDTATLKENGVYKLMYEESNGKRYPLKFGIDVEKLDGSIAYSGSVGDTRTFDNFPSRINVAPGKTIEVPIILDDETKVRIRNKKIIVIYDGYIGKERSIAVCSASTPTGGFVSSN